MSALRALCRGGAYTRIRPKASPKSRLLPRCSFIKATVDEFRSISAASWFATARSWRSTFCSLVARYDTEMISSRLGRSDFIAALALEPSQRSRRNAHRPTLVPHSPSDRCLAILPFRLASVLVRHLAQHGCHPGESHTCTLLPNHYTARPTRALALHPRHASEHHESCSDQWLCRAPCLDCTTR
jgi:hypothetical protein